MRKILALLLAVLMVVPAFAFTTSAEEATTALSSVNFVPVFTEDMMPSNDLTSDELLAWRPANLPDNWLWEGVPAALTYNSTEKGIAATFTGVPSAAGIRFKYSKGLTDITGMTTLCFDMYISDVDDANVTGAEWKFQLYNTNTRDDSTAIAINNATLAQMFGGTLQNGWNHFEIPLNMFNTGTTTFDYTQFSGFRLYNRGANVGATDKTTTLMMKNVYFTNERTVLIVDADMANMSATHKADATSWTGKTAIAPMWRKYGSTSSLVYDSTNKGVGFSISGQITGNYGLQLMFNDTAIGSKDKLCFDLYLSSADHFAANGGAWKLQLTTTQGNTAINNIADKGGFAAYVDGGVLKDGWNHIEIPLSDMNNPSHTTIKDFILFKRNNDAFGAEGETTTVLVNNIYLADDIERGVAEAPQLALVTDADMSDMTAEEQADATTWHKSVYPQWRIGGNTPHVKYNTANKGVGYTVDGVKTGTYRIILNLANFQYAKTSISEWSYLAFDLYLSDVDHFAADGGKWKVCVQTTDKTEKTERYINTTLAQYAGGELKSGWNHVEVPLSLLSSGKDLIYGLYVDKRSDEAFGAAGESTTVLFNNFFLKGETPRVEATVGASAVPTLENDVNFAFQVKANENVIYKPYIHVTFDEKTVVKPLDANGIFSVEDILAHRMSDIITIDVTAVTATGEVTRTTFDYSVKSYAASKLSGEQSDALKTLVSDLLHYGAAAQAAINYNLENMANDVEGILGGRALDTETLAQSMIATPVSGEYTGGAKWKSAKLVLDSAMCIRYVFEAESIEALTVKVNGTEYAIERDTNAENRYYVDVPVNAGQFDEKFVAQFGDNADYTVTYSVNAYIARNYAKYADVEADKAYNTTATYGEMYNLLTAIYNYGVSAAAYNAQ